ncbi:MAG TPA: amidase [Lacipirellulaceae bacterium]|jgi:amidase|nr:amidase [Lacipirellulaceae bacterium]
MTTITFEQSGAFIKRFTLQPTRSGELDGLSFAVKDIIDVAGHRTGFGNPTWLETHPPAAVSAVCVEQVLQAGARCEGKTITDEIAFSLLGENHFYGTPLNAAAPDRVPGGSSSGSASAVSCGLVDFAFGSDTGGSVRVPASNCGIWGLRPSHDRISLAGILPLAPTFDTVGFFARDFNTLDRVASVLLPDESFASADSPSIFFVRDLFDLADAEARRALDAGVERLQSTFGERVQKTSLSELCNDAQAADLDAWLMIYRVLLGSEMTSCHGAWFAAAKPEFGPSPTAGFATVNKLDRTRINEWVSLREHFFRRLNAPLANGDLLCLPSAPSVAPLCGSRAYDRSSDYYQRTSSLNAVAGVARLPQLSMPVGNVGGAPIGLSLAAAHGADRHLLKMAKTVVEQQSLFDK